MTTTDNNVPHLVLAHAGVMALRHLHQYRCDKNPPCGTTDDWEEYGDYDLNLYCEEGILTVTAYRVRVDENGERCTVTDDYTTVYHRRFGA